MPRWIPSRARSPMNQQAKCNQCANAAIYSMNGLPLCLSCFERIQALEQQKLDNLRQLANIAMDQFDAIAPYGMPRTRFDIPKRVQITGGAKMTTINVSGSNIGAINTGVVKRIDSNIVAMASGGGLDIAKSLKEITEAVANSQELSEGQKQEALELLNGISEEAVKPKEERKPGMVKTLAAGVATTVQSAAAVLEIWNKIQPHIGAFFGF